MDLVYVVINGIACLGIFLIMLWELYSNPVTFYRCRMCHSTLTIKSIQKGGCRCGGREIAPTYPTLFEFFYTKALGR